MKRRSTSRKWTVVLLTFAAVFAGAAALLWFRVKPPPAAPQYAGSPSCRDCHAREYELWSKSNHALAERPISALDSAPTNHESAAFSFDRVIGVAPLYQFLARFPNGRWQASQTAFDPAKKEWFDVFNDSRAAGEWGHWTGRGMNWNSMCASCHNTAVQKNYDSKTDSYSTAMAEAGVACEACHGPMKSHVAFRLEKPKAAHDPTIQKHLKDAMLSTCGSCHARRAELTGTFKPGDDFFDHYSLSIPDAGELFYADGQVKEEDFEFTSFLASKMHAAGVRCGDCHDAHSGKALVADSNLLCMRCHSGAPTTTTTRTAPKIDPVAHSHHQQTSKGNQCVECHMPHTTFMQRHARRDHSFTSPDPFLTKHHNIPNACNRCHTDKTTDWALENFQLWYGEKERPARARSQTIAKARAGDAATIPGLLNLAANDPVPLWRASASLLLEQWNARREVRAALLTNASDADPLVRAMAARALHDADANALKPLAKDKVRVVRIETGWALRSTLDTNSAAGVDVLRWLDFNRDQPGGLVNLGLFLNARGQSAEALKCFEQAVAWDPHSAPIRQALATSLGQLGRPAEAVGHLRKACELESTNATYRYLLGLALNEAGKPDETIAALEKAVELDPAFSSAWYNLGLAYSARDEFDRALQCLSTAETLDPNAARIPYARATVLVRAGQIPAAKAAAQRALALDPNFTDAADLLSRF